MCQHNLPCSIVLPTACFPEGPSPHFTLCSFWRRRPRLEAVVFRLLEKYQLIDILYTYIERGTFPTAFAWKRLLKSKLHHSAISTWNSRTLTHNFCGFRDIHFEYTPHWVWYLSKEKRNLLFPSFSLIQMISHLAEMSMDNKFCLHCNVYYKNTVDHCINTCTYFGMERASLWSDI